VLDTYLTGVAALPPAPAAPAGVPAADTEDRSD
jgi:hypothetical protein